MADAFQYDVFLNRSAKDKVVMRASLSASNGERAGVRCRSLHSLRKDGLKVWFDEWVLKAGDSIPAEIEERLEHSRALDSSFFTKLCDFRPNQKST